MKVLTVKIQDLKEITEFRDFYSQQPLDQLVESYKNDGQQNPIHISPDMEIINGYRLVDAIKIAGGTTVDAIIIEGKPTMRKRIVLNQYREKTTDDHLREVREVFNMFPKRQGQKKPDGEKYDRDEMISNSLGNRWKGDVIINKVEHILNNDLDGDILSKGILEKNWKVDTCFDFLKSKMTIDQENGYGFTQQLIDGTYSVAEVNRFIDQRYALDKKHSHTFVIPQKANFYNMDCVDLAGLTEYLKKVDLIITSIPYWALRNYKNGQNRQLGQEATKEEFAHNIADIFNKLIPTLKDSANVIINIGETYKDGLAQGIPFLIKEYISKETPLIHKDTLIWSKKNARPQGEKVKRTLNSIEYLLLFIVDPKKSKYNQLTFPVEGKKIKITRGVKDVSNKGDRSPKRKSVTKNYGKLTSHLDEQQIENIIITSVGKNHDIFKISEIGHPAPMSAMLPVTLTLMLSDEADLVCDPFAGSNIVGKCALELNRQSVSTELSKEYFDIGCEMLTKGAENFDRDSLDIINEMVYPDLHRDQDTNTRIAA